MSDNHNGSCFMLIMLALCMAFWGLLLWWVL